MAADKATINEVDSCAQMASAASQLIGRNPSIYPFHKPRVEGRGKGAAYAGGRCPMEGPV